MCITAFEFRVLTFTLAHYVVAEVGTFVAKRSIHITFLLLSATLHLFYYKYLRAEVS